MRGSHRLNTKLRQRIIRKQREQLRITQASIVSNNCTGAMVAHDLGLQFRTPFVDLWIPYSHYIRLLGNLRHYLLEVPLEEYETDEVSYPVGLIDDITIYFQHYPTFTQAYDSWMRRCQRIDWDDLYVLFVCSNQGHLNELLAFDKLPFKNKIALCPPVSDDYQLPSSARPLHSISLDSQGNLPTLTDYSGICGRRYYDAFDFVSWLNNPT
ncbi:MAG: DUF1919 domain-containing protein [Actinomycetaceae bacterium]|nr:DUF1919 domain-containing protein [Actinomycetaceae bacterium]MDO5747027.1 DUF1919 domain-containing protein [Actinomycetaceae bacterium]